MASIKSITIGTVYDLNEVIFTWPGGFTSVSAQPGEKTDFPSESIPAIGDDEPTSSNAIVILLDGVEPELKDWLMWQDGGSVVRLINTSAPTANAPLWTDNNARGLYLREISGKLVWGYSS